VSPGCTVYVRVAPLLPADASVGSGAGVCVASDFGVSVAFGAGVCVGEAFKVSVGFGVGARVGLDFGASIAPDGGRANESFLEPARTPGLESARKLALEPERKPCPVLLAVLASRGGLAVGLEICVGVVVGGCVGVALGVGVGLAVGWCVGLALGATVGWCVGLALAATVGLLLRSGVGLPLSTTCGPRLGLASALGLAQTAGCRAGSGVVVASSSDWLAPVVSTATSALPPPNPAKATRESTSNGSRAPTIIGIRRRNKDT
jgi:hypothetical protein